VTRAFSIRIPEDLLTRAKKRAAESETSFTAFVTGAIEARLEAPSLLDQKMEPVLAPHGTKAIIRPENAQQQCVHPFRDNPCGVCGVAW
jgi:hypothetical protein